MGDPRNSEGSRWPAWILSLCFGLTGVGVVLPGTLLPYLEVAWRMQDGRSGWLFFLFFLGSTAGALLARGRLGRMLLVAALATSMPLAFLAGLRGIAVPGGMLVSGFGMGLTMTAITLLRSRQAPEKRSRELTRLNLIWAFGACCAPSLLLQLTHSFGLSVVLRWFGGTLLVTGTAASLAAWYERTPAAGQWRAWRVQRGLPWTLVAGLPLSTGIEAGVGAWLTTYALRRGEALTGMVSASSALWAGLLLSRSLFSGRRFQLERGGLVAMAMAGALVGGMLLLLQGDSARSITFGALCVGFAIGPMYPYLLAVLLSEGEAGNVGFLLAGAGSALVPLLIGQVSQRTHSLRLGLLLPSLGAVLLAFSILQTVRMGAMARGE